MSAGRPRSRRPDRRRAGGLRRRARYVDGRDPHALGRELGRIATDPALRRDLSERGRRRAAEFSWARSARAHAAAYALAVGLSRARAAAA
jgi:glycosyltransferase involved in cell wall biosynthesis